MTMGAEEFGRIAITIQVYMILMKWRVDVEFKEFPIYQCHNFKVEEEEEEESKFQIEDDELCTKRKNANNATGISWRKWHQEFLHGVGIKHDNSENSYNRLEVGLRVRVVRDDLRGNSMASEELV